MERVSEDKPSSLLGLVVSDEGKMFYNIDICSLFSSLFLPSKKFLLQPKVSLSLTCLYFYIIRRVKFYLVNSLDVATNRWLNLLSKIWLFLNLAKHTSRIFSNSKDSNSRLIFSTASVVDEFLWFFSPNKSCKTYLASILQTGNWFNLFLRLWFPGDKIGHFFANWASFQSLLLLFEKM